jgi:hypothetical protein
MPIVVRRIKPTGLVCLFIGSDTKLWVALPKMIGIIMDNFRIPILHNDRIEYHYEWARDQVEALEKIGLAPNEVILENQIEVMT